MEVGEFRWRRGLKFCVFLYAIGTPLGIVRTVFAHEVSPSAWMWTCVATYAVAILIRVLPPWVRGGRARFFPWLPEIVFFAGFLIFASTADRGGLFFFALGGWRPPGSEDRRDPWEKWMKHWCR